MIARSLCNAVFGRAGVTRRAKTHLFFAGLLLFITLLPATSEARLSSFDPSGIGPLVDKVKRGVLGVSSGLDATDDPALAGGNITSGGGSGFIIDKQGHFISNFHVMGRASVVQVKLWDGSTYKARRVASDVSIDIALGKIEGIDPSRIHPIKLGDSDEVRVGDMTFAMGNPGSSESYLTDISKPGFEFLMSSTVTARTVAGVTEARDFAFVVWAYLRTQFGLQYGTNLSYVFRMQTPINGGNSGGPLLNRKGEVVGINTWGGEGSLQQNSNYAVPVNLAKAFVTSVLEGKQPERPWIGVDVLFPRNIENVTSYETFRKKIERRKAVDVFSVRRGSPADLTGIRNNDILLAADGIRFTDSNEFRKYIMFKTRIGQELKLIIVRNGRAFPVTLRTVEKPRQYAEFSV